MRAAPLAAVGGMFAVVTIHLISKYWDILYPYTLPAFVERLFS